MKNIVGTLLCAFATAAALPAMAGNTIIRVGLAADNPNEVIQGVTTNTTQIDAVLGQVPGLSNTPTGDLTDDLFQELDETITEIEVALRQALLADSSITQVYSLSLDPDPARLTLSQVSTGVGAKIGEVDGQLSVKVSVPVCGSYRVDAKIYNFRVEADYDVWNGTVENAAINYELGPINVSSLGLLGPICQLGFEIISGQSVKTTIINELRQQADNLVMEAEMEELFSLRDIIQSARDFILTIDAPNFNFQSYNINMIAEEARDHAIEALDHAVNVLDQDSFQGTGLDVTLELFPQSPNNILNLIVSHNPANIPNLEVDNRCATFSVSFGERTAYGTLFRKPFGSGYWQEEKRVYGWGQDFLGGVNPGDQFIVIAKSNLFGNLYSRPDIDNVFTYRTQNGYLPLPYETFCDGEGLPGGGGGFGGGGLTLPFGN